jgi:small-conductance mechanosensitive channel
MQVQLVDALVAAAVSPTSPAWLLFTVVAQLLAELETVRASIGPGIRAEVDAASARLERATEALRGAALDSALEAVDAARALRTSLDSNVADALARERAKTRRVAAAHRRLVRVLVILAAAALVATAVIFFIVGHAACRR